jgi:phosphate transport system substrate-binding protein
MLALMSQHEQKEGAVRSRLFWLAATIAAGLALVLAAGCGDDNKGGGSDLSGSIKIDGSSTVGPLTEAAAELFREENPNVKVTVGISGTGGGFEKFCNKEIDISDASRPIDDEEEVPVCEKNGVSYDQIQVANDGITVVVNPDNDWAKCLTTDELKKIWDKGSKVNNWNQVRSDFPDQKMKLFGPGTDSGTFDFFTEEINGEKGQSRSDYSPSEDDNVTVQGVSGDKGNSGYYGLSYAEENTDKNKIVQVDDGNGCVTPSAETVQDGSYKPLARPIFIYPSVAALKRPEVDAFVKFYVDNYDQIAQQAKLVPMTTEQADKAKATADKVAGGT